MCTYYLTRARQVSGKLASLALSLALERFNCTKQQRQDAIPARSLLITTKETKALIWRKAWIVDKYNIISTWKSCLRVVAAMQFGHRYLCTYGTRLGTYLPLPFSPFFLVNVCQCRSDTIRDREKFCPASLLPLFFLRSFSAKWKAPRIHNLYHPQQRRRLCC